MNLDEVVDTAVDGVLAYETKSAADEASAPTSVLKNIDLAKILPALIGAGAGGLGGYMSAPVDERDDAKAKATARKRALIGALLGGGLGAGGGMLASEIAKDPGYLEKQIKSLGGKIDDPANRREPPPTAVGGAQSALNEINKQIGEHGIAKTLGGAFALAQPIRAIQSLLGIKPRTITGTIAGSPTAGLMRLGEAIGATHGERSVRNWKGVRNLMSRSLVDKGAPTTIFADAGLLSDTTKGAPQVPSRLDPYKAKLLKFMLPFQQDPAAAQAKRWTELKLRKIENRNKRFQARYDALSQADRAALEAKLEPFAKERGARQGRAWAAASTLPMLWGSRGIVRDLATDPLAKLMYGLSPYKPGAPVSKGTKFLNAIQHGMDLDRFARDEQK